MEITQSQYDEWIKSQIGKICQKHNNPIMLGKYGLWCGAKNEYGSWCDGNPYPKPEGESLTIKPD